MRCSPERKNAILKKMMPPRSKSIKQIAKEEGIGESTLYNWRKEARNKGILLPDADANPKGWSSKDKFAAVMESATLNEHELGEYCRKNGIYPQQLEQWHKACEHANDWDEHTTTKLKSEQKDNLSRIKKLEKELNRKEKALAEAAALLMLKKKIHEHWGDPEDD